MKETNRKADAQKDVIDCSWPVLQALSGIAPDDKGVFVNLLTSSIGYNITLFKPGEVCLGIRTLSVQDISPLRCKDGRLLGNQLIESKIAL